MITFVSRSISALLRGSTCLGINECATALSCNDDGDITHRRRIASWLYLPETEKKKRTGNKKAKKKKKNKKKKRKRHLYKSAQNVGRYLFKHLCKAVTTYTSLVSRWSWECGFVEEKRASAKFSMQFFHASTTAVAMSSLDKHKRARDRGGISVYIFAVR